MRKSIFLFITFVIIGNAKAQSVGIGTITPATSAQLDVTSTTKGFLPPRLTYAQRNAIQNPVSGLVIWCSDCDELQVFNGTIWKNLLGSAACSSPSPPSVAICNQVWMVKNLDVSTYRNGDPIPKVTDDAAWQAISTGAYCYYNNDSATYAATYGKLYNWYAVNDPRGLAPAGWHVPSDDEWSTLSTCLGGDAVAGGKMKETETTHWLFPNTEATNSSGFTGLPGGTRGYFTFSWVANSGYWWSTTVQYPGAQGSLSRNLYYESGSTGPGNGNWHNGYSVRCIKD